MILIDARGHLLKKYTSSCAYENYVSVIIRRERNYDIMIRYYFGISTYVYNVLSVFDLLVCILKYSGYYRVSLSARGK